MKRRTALLLLLAAAAPPSADETLTVHGRRPRFAPAPLPERDNRFDPPGSGNGLRDTDTGADLGAFGPAYSAATPAPPVNRVERGDLQDDPLPVGPPHA